MRSTWPTRGAYKGGASATAAVDAPTLQVADVSLEVCCVPPHRVPVSDFELEQPRK